MNKSSSPHRVIAVRIAGIAIVISLMAGIALFYRANAAPVASGLTPLVTETGHISLSIDGGGARLAQHTIQVNKPAGATVRKAYLAAATNFQQTLSNTDITLDGQPVAWDKSMPGVSQGWITNYWTDVTAMVKPKIDGAPAGLIDFSMYAKGYYVDGEILIVIFDDPNQTSDNTVILFWGAVDPHGDNFQITLGSPIDPSDPNLELDLSLGISYGNQRASNNFREVSHVDVNGQRMTSSAGGQDDTGNNVNSLLTVGGIGDSNALPASATDPPTDFRYDDELYSLKSFVQPGDTSISIDTINPSNDDNIFFAGIFLTVPAAIGPLPSPTGKIVVDKVTNPAGDPQSFAFSLTGGPDSVSQNFSLTDAAPPYDSGSIKTGTYNIAETLPAGWDLSNATCDDGSPPNAVAVDPDETVTCIFTNAKHPTLTVVKQTVGGNGTFPFTSATLPGGDFAIATTGVTGNKTYTNLTPGTYDLAETPPAGWDLTSSSCDNGKTLPNITLNLGDNVTCTFTNTKLAKLTVVKNTVGGDGTFDFTSAALPGGDFTITTTGATGNKVYTNLLPGTYDLAETTPAGWDLTDSVCDNGKTLPNVALAAGDNVTCTFTNTKRGEIQIKKSTSPAGGSGFGFTQNIDGSGPFTLDDGGTQTFSNVLPGQYTVTEDDPAGGNYELSGLTCSNSASSVDPGNRTATISVDPGETVVCTFTNTEDDTVTIEKVTIPAGAGGYFRFSQDLDASGNFALSGGQSKHFTNVSPGSYTVAEATPPTDLGPVPGFELTAIDCQDTAGRTFPVDLNAGTASLTNLTPGENVHCAFTNTQLGHMFINKKTVGGDPFKDFGFTSNVPGSATFALRNGETRQMRSYPAGVYTVTEDDLSGTDYALTDLVCDDANGSVNLATRTATIRLDPGDVVNCTFTNTKLGEIIVDKVTDPTGDPQPFDFTLGGGPDSVHQIFTLTDAATPYKSSGLKPGSYNIAETLPAGWDQDSATCDDGSDPLSVQLDAGETVTCTFNNTKRGKILIDKVTDPGGSSQSFDFNLTGGPDNINQIFSLTDAAAPHDSGVLKPGTYSAVETVPAGWDLTSAVCDDGSDPGTIHLGPGEEVTCTFTNTEDGTIVVRKVTQPSGSPQLFDFTVTGPGNVNETFQMKDGELYAINHLDPGSGYNVAETVPAGWTTGPAACDNGSDPTNVLVEPGKTVTCTFTNLQDDVFAVGKLTIPSSGVGFDFTDDIIDPNGHTFTLADGDIAIFSQLQPQVTHTVTEDDPTSLGYTLVDIACAGQFEVPPTTDIANRKITYRQTPGEAGACIFLNEKMGKIVVDKVTDPAGDPQSFDFALTGGPDQVNQNFALTDAATPYDSGNLKPGTYKVNESLPSGWDLSKAKCDNGSDPRKKIIVGPGETVTCTFENTKPGRIIVDKVTNPAGDPQSFDFTLLGGPDNVSQAFSLTDADQPYDSGELKPGTYNVDEHLLTGWDLYAATCDDGSDPANIDLAAGEAVTCTFNNAHVHVNLIESYAVSSVTEGQLSGEGSIACYWVTLSTQPAGDVTVSMAPQLGLVTLDKSSVTLNASNWNNLTLTNRSNFVCMRAVDDHKDNTGPQICKDGNDDIHGAGNLVPDKECGDQVDEIAHSVTASTDPAYNPSTPFVSNSPQDLDNNPATIDALVRDNDKAGVVITESYSVTDLDEGGSPVGLACYWLNLSAQPAAPVIISVSPDPAHVNVSKASVTLTPANWNVLTPQSAFNKVCVTPVNDNIINPKDPRQAMKNQDIFGNGPDDHLVNGDYLAHIGHSAASADPKFDNTSNFIGNGPNFDNDVSTIDVLMRDDDHAVVLVAPAHLSVREGATASFQVSLGSQPTAPVTVSGSTTRAAGSQDLVFDASNWDQPQEMTISAPEDNVATGPQQKAIQLRVTSADNHYQGIIPAPVDVVVVDDDSAGVMVSTTQLALSEGGGEATYEVSLTSQPTADLTITLVGDQVTTTPAALTFTPANWQQAQTVRVQAVDDAKVEANGHAGSIQHVASSADGAYNGILISDVGATIQDNDVAGLTASGTSGLQAAEGGADASYSVRLTSQPDGAVLVSLSGGGQLALDPAALTFTDQNWNQPQTVTVKALDDAVDEGDSYAALVSYSLTGDPTYQGLPVAPQTVTVVDNDTAGVRLSTTAIQADRGAKATYTVALASQPLGDVVVDLSASGGAALDMPACNADGAGACLLFTAANWNQPQTVTVRVAGPGQVTHTVVSSDGLYDGLAASPVDVTLGDSGNMRSIFLPLVSK